MIEFNATFLVAMISFVVFMLIMNAVFYKPVLNMMRKREDFVNSNYEKAGKYNEQAQNCLNEYDTKLEEVRAKSRDDMAKTVETAQKSAFNKITETKEEAKIQIQSQKETFEKAKKDIENRIKSDVISDLSDILIGKIVGEQ